jgi:tetratricopeptide (TPR) repeat protein
MIKALALEPELATTAPATAPKPREETRGLPMVELARENRRHDLILGGLTLLLAFLLASFPVLNSDIWLQLRTGQMILNGEFAFGSDPFSYIEHPWVHTAWLWDVLVYAVYALGQGPALVLLRGLLVLGLAALLFQIRRPEATLLPVVLSLALAFVAMSARLFLRSELSSLVFVGMTLYLLWRPAAPPRSALLRRVFGLTQNRAWVLLPPLFALWANCDYWFFLGPCMVLLYLVGEVLQEIFNPQPARTTGLAALERRSLLLVLGVGILACLLNPYTFRVFLQLPGDLKSETLDLLMLSQGFKVVGRGYVSPFSREYFQGLQFNELWWRPLGLSVAEWCYFPLAALSLVSFVLNWKGLRFWRLLLWLGFLVLSFWQARNAALFAVVAGPVMGLNLQEWVAAQTGERANARLGWVIAGQATRILALITVLTLCFLTTVRMDAPSLQMRGRETALGLIHSRGLGWSMQVDASLRNSAQKLADWQLPGRGFSMDWREEPAYLAFYNRSGKSFMDTRFQLHGASAEGYFKIAANLREVNPLRLDKRPTHQHYQWQDAFQKHDISHLLVSANATVSAPHPEAPGGAMSRRLVDLLLADEIETTDASGKRIRQRVWELLNYIDGRTFILAWTGSPHYDKLKALRFDPEREAFRSPSLLPPPRGPDLTQSTSPLASWLAGELNRPPLGVDEAVWLLTASQNTYDRSFVQAMAATLLPLGERPISGAPGAFAFAPPLLHVEALTHAEHQLAIRAARRAIAEQPLQAEAYHALYQAYVDLYSIERELGPPIGLREMQIVAALREAVRRRPQEPVTQLELANLYLRRGVSDLAVMHFEEAVRAAEAIGKQEELAQMARLQPFAPLQNIGQMSQILANRRASFNARAVLLASNPSERARLAIELGLNDEARQALETVVSQLPPQQDSQLGVLAVRQLVDLYLRLGYLPELLALLYREETARRLGPVVYRHRGALARAALGDYQGSVREFVAMDEELKKFAIEHTLLGVGLHSRGAQSEMPGSLMQGLDQLYEAQNSNNQRTEALLQAGLVALEAGWTQPTAAQTDAATIFKRALREVNAGAPHRALMVRYYRLMTNQWIDE